MSSARRQFIGLPDGPSCRPSHEIHDPARNFLPTSVLQQLIGRMRTNPFVVVGLMMIASALIWLIAGVLAVAHADRLVLGVNGLRSLGSFSVLGCLMAAFGCWKQEQESSKCSETQTSSSS